MPGFFLNSKDVEVITVMLLTIQAFFQRNAVRHVIPEKLYMFLKFVLSADFEKAIAVNHLRIETYMTMKSAETRGICLPQLKKTIQCLRGVIDMMPAGQAQVKELSHQCEFRRLFVWILSLLLGSFQSDARRVYLIPVCFIFFYIKLK